MRNYALNPKTGVRIRASIFTLALAGALSGCAAYHEYEKCGYDGCPGDAKITAEVKQALARHPDLEGTDTVYVETINHMVYLTGTVDSGLQREAAESVARKASGVSRVVDNISIDKQEIRSHLWLPAEHSTHCSPPEQPRL